MGRQKHGEKVPLQHLSKEQTINAEQRGGPHEALPAARPNPYLASGKAGEKSWHAEPLDQRAREDRYRRQTGRANRCPDDMETAVEGRFIPAHQRARLLGLTPKQRRRSEHKANRAEARMLTGARR